MFACRSAAARPAAPSLHRQTTVATTNSRLISKLHSHPSHTTAAETAPQLRPPPVRRVPPPPPPGSPAANKPQHHRMAAARQAAAAAAAAAQQCAPSITLAVVGDVHSQWDADSEAALLSLGADVAVFVGDFGEEVLPLIKQIAAVPHPKAVILGNHDAWFSLTRNGRQRYARAMMASSSLEVRQRQQQGFSEGGSTPAIAAQLEALGADHVGYSSKRFPQLGLTLLGARPFSKGGKRWSDVADFYEEHFGISGMQDSAHRILDVALAAPQQDVKVVVAHNGPAGLGGRRFSICGVDWTEPEADFGDPDLQEALDMMAAQGLRVPLVLFGHMHSQLTGSGNRNMVEVDPASGTVYLNAAVVPRMRSLPVPSTPAAGGNGGSSGNGSGSGEEERLRGHHFVLVELRQGVVAAARDVWVGVQHGEASDAPGSSDNGCSSSSSTAGGSGRRCIVLREQELIKTSLPPAATAGAAAAVAATAEDGRRRAGAAAAAAAAAAAGGAAGGGSDGGSSAGSGAYVCSIFRGNTGEWEPVVLQLPAGAAAAQLAECS